MKKLIAFTFGLLLITKLFCWPKDGKTHEESLLIRSEALIHVYKLYKKLDFSERENHIATLINTKKQLLQQLRSSPAISPQAQNIILNRIESIIIY